MKTKFIKRTWLTEGNHSSSYIMCHYDEECLSWGFKCFVRIGDCNSTITLRRQTTKRGLNSLILLIDNLISVIQGKRKSFTYKKGITKLEVKYKELISSFVTVNKEISFKFKENEGEINEVLIHKDKFTCNELEWKHKVAVLVNELTEFKDFLITKI